MDELADAEAPAAPQFADQPSVSEATPAAEASPTDADAGAAWEAIASAFQREAQTLESGPPAALLFREAARIREFHLKDPRLALGLYLRALQSDPQQLPALRAARCLAQILGDAPLACKLLELEATRAPTPRDVALLTLARARLLEEPLGRVSEARSALAAAALSDPENLAVADHEATLAALERRHEDLVRQLERCASLSPDPALAATWLICASAMEENRLGHPDRATDLALRAFELAPEEPGVRAEARRQAERSHRYAPLAAILEADAAAATDSRDATLAWCAVARLYEERLDRRAEAEAALARAREAAGRDLIALDALARLQEVRGAWEEAAEVLHICASSTATSAPQEANEVIDANLRLAEIYTDRLARPEAATACYQAIVALSPGHRVALSALGRIYAGASDWEHLLEVCMAERAAASEGRDKAQRCFKAAEVLHERLDRLDEALALYAEALALDPGLAEARERLERLYERANRYPELAALLESDLASIAAPDERISVLFRLARLYEDRLLDLAAAAEAYQRILTLDPRREAALRALMNLHERAGRYEQLVEVIEQLAELAPDPRRTLALLQRKAEVQEEHLSASESATETYERILKLEPSYLPALRALGRLYAKAARWKELVAMCRDEAEVSPSTEAAANVLHRVGDILERRLGQEREAIAAYREALTLSPTHVGALRALARLYRGRGDWEDLIEVLRSEAAARPSPERQAVLLSEVADIWETRLVDLERALEVHDEVLRILPGFGPSARALDRLLADAGRWTELARLRQEKAQRSQGTERAALFVNAARVFMDRLGDTHSAEALCRAALEVYPDDVGAWVVLARLPATRAEARTALASRMNDRDPARAAQLLVGAGLDQLNGGSTAAGLSTLQRVARLAPDDALTSPFEESACRLREPAAFGAFCEAHAAAVDDDQVKLDWTLRAAEAWEAAGQSDRALEAFRRGATLDSTAVPALAGVVRQQIEREAWQEAHDACVARGEAHSDAQLAIAAFAEAGALASAKLRDEGLAAEDWQRAWRRDPLDPEITDRLLSLYRSLGRLADACVLQEARARNEREPSRGVSAWTLAAQIAFEAGDHVRALSDVERALEFSPSALEALQLRGRLFVADGRWGEAARDLTSCLPLAESQEARAALHLELASLYDGALADAPRALSHVHAVLAAVPDHPVALARLARVHREAHNWPAAADALRRLVASDDAPAPARRDHLLALAEVLELGYDDIAGAHAACERALEIVPGDTEVLERLVHVRSRAGDHAGVVATLEAAAAVTSPGADRAKVHLRAAHVLATSLGDDEGAIIQARRAIDTDPDNIEARLTLAELFTATEPMRAVDIHRQLLIDDPLRIESWRALFSIFLATKAQDRAFVTAAVLRFLKRSDPAVDGAFLDRHAGQVPMGSGVELTANEWVALRHPLDRGPLSELLAVTGHALAETLDWPIEPKDRAKIAPALTRLSEEIAFNAGVEPFTLRGGEGAEVRVSPRDPPIVRVGSEVAELCLGEQRFLLARAAARIRARSGLALRLSGAELGALLAAVVAQVDPAFVGLGQPAAQVIRAVGRALPRKARKALEEPVRALKQNAPQDLEGWRDALGWSADRLGLLLSADLPAALARVLRETGGAASGIGLEAAVREKPELKQLLAFAVSDEFFHLRQRLKLAVL